MDEEGQEFGEERLLELLRASPRGSDAASAADKDISRITGQGSPGASFPSAAATLQELMAAVERFAGATRQHDDITCLVLRTT